MAKATVRQYISPSSIARAVATVLLILALGRHPYGYYVFLRWAVCGTSTYTAWISGISGKAGWAWALGVVAVLFNPIVPVHLKRDTWAVLNVASAGLLMASIAYVREKPRAQK
jgi:hypothetical protein